VAVIGASSDPAKWGNRIALGAVRGERRRGVYLVNRSGREILGRPVYRSLAELPEPPELVVVTVPEAGFEEAVDSSLDAGAKALVAISAGLGETGEEGQARERAVVERVRAAGAVLLGPNCLGVFDSEAELDLGWSELPSGSIGFISQSGNLALELALLAEDSGLGFSRFASLGNQADLEAAEFVAAFAEHEPTRVIALYCEDFRDGRTFAAAAHAAVESGKPVILLAAGRSDASMHAARSHTGALVSDLAAVDAACRAAGIDRVSTPKELIDLAQASLARNLPRGRRIAVVCEPRRLEPELSGQLRERKLGNIASVNPELIVTANIGCMMQLKGGTSAPFVHTIEMLDWATGGPAPEALGPLKDTGHPIEALVELARQTALVD